jgi:carbon starvation protein
MGFVMTITVWSLVLQIRSAARAAAATGLHLDLATINGVVCVLLLLLAVVMVAEAAQALRAPRVQATAA